MVEDTIALHVIRDARGEDREAMKEMIHSFQPVLTYIASCHIKSPELIQATVRSCLGSLFVLLSKTEDLSKFEQKAMSMVVRTCLNAALQEDRGQRLFSENGSNPEEKKAVYTFTDEGASGPRQFTEKEAMNIVVNMLRHLPDDERILFVMRYCDGFTFTRISAMVHLPEDLLKKRAQIAKETLARNTSRSVGEVFAILKLAEENKHLVLSEEEPGRESAEEESGKLSASETAREKKPLSIHPVMLVIPAAVLVMALGLRFTVFRKAETVSLLEGLKCSFTGVNGAGSASVTLAETGNARIDRVLASSVCTLKGADGEEVGEGVLSNGDELTYACRFDEDALKKAHIEPSDDQVSVTVEGLNDPAPIDLFESVYLGVTKDEETGSVQLFAAAEDPKYQVVGYSIVAQDEEGIQVYADIPDETLLSYGFVTDTHYHTFAETDVPEEYRGEVRMQIVEEGLANTAEHHDAYGYEVANGSDPEINALAQSYIGRGGACNVIANAFIRDLYGVEVHTGYSRMNLYEVDAPAPGDLINYYDSNGSFRHVATYIGNGLVLNGNYADGTAHITSMYESWYSQNPMVFLRVQR